jgi:hypothetical protein
MNRKIFKKNITQEEWDKKFMRLRDLQVSAIQSANIMNKYYVICEKKEQDEEDLGV